MKKVGIKTKTSPQICCHTNLQKVSVQLCVFAAQLIHFKVMQIHLITVNVHEGCLFPCLFTQIILPHIFKTAVFCTCAGFSSCTALANGCINYALFNATICQAFIFIIESQCNKQNTCSVIRMSVSGKNN